MKHHILLLSLLLCISANAQTIYTPILEQIEQNSTTLKALQAAAQAQKLENKTGLTPENPEVEFGYLWGNPLAIGNRQDLSVKQTIDFPTVYLQKSKLAGEQNASAEYEYRSERMQLLLSAKNTCIELIYYNALAQLYAAELQRSQKICQAYEKMATEGSVGILDRNKAVLNATEISNKIKAIEIEQTRLLSELARLNGGQSVEFSISDYSPVLLPQDFEAWYSEAEAENPALQYLKSQVQVSTRQVQVASSSSLPKISVGYMGEFTLGQRYSGLTVGLTIPLWENKNRVKQARAEVAAQEQIMEDAKVEYYNSLKYLYAQAAQLQENAAQYATVLSTYDNSQLLFKAYQAGEISLLTYLVELSYYLEAHTNYLETQRDLALALAALEAYQL